MKKTKDIKKNEDDDQQDNPVSDFDTAHDEGGWTEHRDGDVLKLEPGQSIAGMLLSKGNSVKYNNCGVYKIQVKDEPVPKVILGSKQLDRIMVDVNVGSELRIVFEGTQPTTKGNAMKVFKVFTKG